MHLPCSLTPDRLYSLTAYGNKVLSPQFGKRRPVSQNSISELNCTAFAPAVYASCPHYCELCKTRSRWMVSPYRAGLFTCWVSKIGFKERLFSPYHGLIMARPKYESFTNIRITNGLDVGCWIRFRTETV